LPGLLLALTIVIGIQWRCAALLMVAFRGWSAGGLAEVHQ
jgi:hypothetical protein